VKQYLGNRDTNKDKGDIKGGRSGWNLPVSPVRQLARLIKKTSLMRRSLIIRGKKVVLQETGSLSVILDIGSNNLYLIHRGFSEATLEIKNGMVRIYPRLR
jgi:hypothetical protein